MAVTKDTVYIKSEQNVEVKKREVRLGDILSLECTNEKIAARIKTILLLKIPDTGKHRYVVSILKIIECIHREYPNLDIQNLGVPDIIVTYEEQKVTNPIGHFLKIVGVVAVTFIGAGFSIMAFNNDVDVSRLCAQIYEFFMGKPKEGFSVLELTYCVGLIVGILAFFNHFGGKKFTVDPTPMEVEMRLYENDIQTTLIENYSRKEQEMDVGKTSHSRSHRT